ncbi:hypothetical protein GN958_ATG07563 [Phytophthora infestans]|uniref:Retrotransposon gag domain-containing protein n=1 Tax=Phytophthora infestans TaxID=4787 RepID=A0A8S9UVB4_PHYIN|nr:hypothetical protein GN958_ATG07563 [Phytophthora infestans]
MGSTRKSRYSPSQICSRAAASARLDRRDASAADCDRRRPCINCAPDGPTASRLKSIWRVIRRRKPPTSLSQTTKKRGRRALSLAHPVRHQRERAVRASKTPPKCLRNRHEIVGRQDHQERHDIHSAGKPDPAGLDEARTDRSQEWKSCYETREREAHTEIALSLHGELWDRFKSDIESVHPVQQWTALLRNYDETQGTNSAYLKQDRRLRQGEGVMGYIKDLQRMRCELECMNVSSLPEGKRASVVLSNAVNVYPVIANELTQHAVNLLLVAERAAQAQKGRGNHDGGRGVQCQVNVVNHHQGSNRQSRGNKRCHGGNNGHEIEGLKRTTEGKSCHKRGHWWKPCSERQLMNRMKIRSMSNAVLRHVESSGKDGGSGSIVSEESRRERFQAGILNTHPVLDGEDEDERGASSLPVAPRVLAVASNGGAEAVPVDEIKWILHSGAK